MPVLALLVLSPIGAELLAAYNDTTGRPLALLGNLVFFAALYGCPALLIRELVRRTGRGWTATLLLCAAAGLLQAGVLDQSLFSESYEDVRGWEETVRATYVAPLGLSAYMAQNFILGHVIFSFAAPIVLAEALRPDEPWLRRRGIVLATVAWLTVAALLIVDTSEPRARPAELAVTLIVVAVLVVTALRLPGPRSRRPPPRVRTTLAGAVALTAGYSVAPETWAGFALAVTIAALGAALLARHRWTLRHAAAIATGALLARGLLAFTYYPVVGETTAAQKYAHNVVMLAIVAAAGAYSCRRAA